VYKWILCTLSAAVSVHTAGQMSPFMLRAAFILVQSIPFHKGVRIGCRIPVRLQGKLVKPFVSNFCLVGPGCTSLCCCCCEPQTRFSCCVTCSLLLSNDSRCHYEDTGPVKLGRIWALVIAPTRSHMFPVNQLLTCMQCTPLLHS